MKKENKIYFLATAMFLVCTVAVNAQQKASDRTLEEEMKKVNEKRAARTIFINRMRQSTPVENQVATPADQKINTEASTTVNPGPATTNQASSNLKPSQQPMRIPKKPAVIKQ
jgi:uncharacterized membrane protein